MRPRGSSPTVTRVARRGIRPVGRSFGGLARRALRRFAWRTGRTAAVLALAFGAVKASDLAMGFRPAHADCRVLQVVDGDTLDLRCPGEGLVRARLTGFDTPELFSPGCAAEAAAALAAQFHLRRTLWGAERFEVRLAGSDRYGRRLAEARVDGRGVAEAMIAAGHARPYRGGRRAGWCA